MRNDFSPSPSVTAVPLSPSACGTASCTSSSGAPLGYYVIKEPTAFFFFKKPAKVDPVSFGQTEVS